MLFKVIYHKRTPCKTPETFDCGIWAAILISETSSVVSGVTASCNIKQVSFFFSGEKVSDKFNYFVLNLINKCFIIPLHSNCMLNNIKVVFLLWNPVKQRKLALKKSHNLSHNSPILSHNLPWKYRTISDF